MHLAKQEAKRNHKKIKPVNSHRKVATSIKLKFHFLILKSSINSVQYNCLKPHLELNAAFIVIYLFTWHYYLRMKSSKYLPKTYRYNAKCFRS